MTEERENKKEKNTLTKDPFFKPVILGGLTLACLSFIFAPAIFIWATLGGYVAVRLTYKTTKEVISLFDTLLVGLFTGIVGATFINLVTVISFNNGEKRRLLIETLEKNWPSDMASIPNFSDVLPSIFFTASIFVVLISIAFALLGAYIGLQLTKKKLKQG